MLLSYSHKFIFIKTQKTASTSVECFLEKFCRPEGYNIEMNTSGSVSEFGIVGTRGIDNDIIWRNHMPAEDIKYNIPENIWNNYCKIATIRNPFDQVVSVWWFYTFLKDRNIHKSLINLPHEYIKEQFKKDILSLDNSKFPNVKSIICVDGRSVIDKFIRYENIQNDMEELCKYLGITVECILPKMRTNFRLSKEPYQNYYDDETMNFISNKYKWEFDTFGYTFQN